MLAFAAAFPPHREPSDEGRQLLQIDIELSCLLSMASNTKDATVPTCLIRRHALEIANILDTF
eukprot:10196218-Prorocentrum_lima.AAC.1